MLVPVCGYNRSQDKLLVGFIVCERWFRWYYTRWARLIWLFFVIAGITGMTEECLFRKHLEYEVQLVNEYQRGSSEWAVWRRRASHGLHAAPVTACRRPAHHLVGLDGRQCSCDRYAARLGCVYQIKLRHLLYFFKEIGPLMSEPHHYY